MALAASTEIRLAPSYRAYAQNSDELAKTAARLTSGLRVMRTGDDTASLSTATRLQTQTSTLRSVLVNGAKASSLLQIASDGLSQIRTVLTTLDSLASAATDGGISDLQFATLDGQFQDAFSQIDTIVAATRFDGSSLLDGSVSGATAPIITTGDADDDSVTLTIPDVSSSALFAASPSIDNVPNATSATTAVATAQQTLDEAIALVDAYQKRLDIVDAAVKRRIYGLTSASEGLLNTDVAAESNAAEQLSLQQQTTAMILAAQADSLSTSLLGLVN